MDKTKERLIAKKAKKAADALLDFLQIDQKAVAKEGKTEELHLVFDYLAKKTADHGGPAWNATDEQWEF